MKKKYIIGISIITIFLIILVYFFSQSIIPYEENFQKITTTDKTVKATGKYVKEKEYFYNEKINKFTFYITDANGVELKVNYAGKIPINFEIATSLVITGRYVEGIFEATEILTKCPSKYQNEFEQKAK
ncbi:MAG: cytochrome c maturation protein CcmE [Ignavibacteriales bacterium]|nr:cytochrome c maturation protein CcmE [Ignavibacteriales bacterium]